MDQIEFADGFDRPDQLAFGLSAGQLMVVMVGALSAYSLVRSPLPPVLVDPPAVAIATVAAALGWLRFGGRPMLDWAVFAAQYSMRSRRGTVQCEASVESVPAWFAASDSSDTETIADGGGPAGDATTVSAPEEPILELFGDGQMSPARVPVPQAPLPPAARRDGPRRVTFFSLRGGTGRSTLATELACLLAASHSDANPALKVALIDLDMRSPTVGVRLGTPERTLLDYALAPPEERTLADFMIAHASGARVLLGPQRTVHPEWPVTPALLREVLRELDMDGFDLVVLDVSPELSPVTTTALCACDDVFIVVVPTAGGVQDAYRSTEALRRLGLRHQLRYIVNRSRPGTDLSEPMGDLGGQLIGDIPDDDAVVVAENAHRLVGLEESGPAAIALRRLARRFGNELRAPWAS